ncbi:uncharacterized protein Z518_11117 [Rhinocladiella mackenziei CBS 650.93]|uniref:Rhinocladiella mackenziei CBS 650.93 unplaced genomic scaffold supercont1.11, whole genome shotgun sequence n=1 Tax=Rhinocladiella mackenziei CBS 650.93 TaxID=1442369 RepID=A0A0D2ISG4_9EURO|nr:uncharacterized protein Z518_11117 [Rhinocladiella mackenziei CBS 650.93]KIW99704.1 hypothetical protein Z518_11117 [Rhinocladiella mackenziei CBS 650.93]
MNIVQFWPSGKFDGRLNVLLYTRAGQATTSWPIVGVGREVDSRRRSYASIVTEWLRLCREDHPAYPSNTDVPLPTRLLDVGPFESNSIRLRVTAGQRGLYTALSHCWGGDIEIRTTRDSIAARQKQILYSDLPKTFQDAVTVTRDLGLRYLWIDALCIIQDDAQDWEGESGNMTAVYQNAYTVIGADMSLDSHNGFLKTESGGHYFDQGVLIAAIDSEESLIYARPMMFHENPCPIFKNGPPEPLSKRAWTMQEQMLASRMIHFAKREMIWECNSALLCECMELDGQYSPFAINQKPMLMTSHWSVKNFKTWYKVVEEVTNRNITKPGDILPCLSGLARRFQDAGAGTYLAGLWLDDLLLGLLWEGSQHCSRATPYRAPSWSWASVRVDNSYISPHFRTGGFLDDDTKLTKTYARIVEASCTQKGKDPLGAISDGYVKIVAPMLEMAPDEYLESLNVCHVTPLGVKHGSRKLTVLLDFEFAPSRDENLFCLFVGELSCGSNGVPCRGLVLRKRWDISEMYERVGSFSLERGAEVDFIQGIEDSTVVII